MKTTRTYLFLFTVLIVLLYSASPVMGVAPTSEVMEKLASEGRLESFLERLHNAQTRGVDQPSEKTTAVNLSVSFDDSTVDTVHVLVLMVDFYDRPYQIGYKGGTAEQFDSILFSTGGVNPTGSMTEYYLENSYGKFHIIGDIFGWFRMPESHAYYADTLYGLGWFPNNSQGLALDAVTAAENAGVDFSEYDIYGPGGMPDGYVDGLFIVHAGTGHEESGDNGDIHSHKWSLGYFQTSFDGVIIDDYTMEPEESYNSRSLSHIGVFCHEFGHFIGLPDLYDIRDITQTSVGIGRWSLMATGCYNGGSRRPAHLDAWCKSYLGYVETVEITENLTDVVIPQIETNPIVYKLWADGDYSGEQYFLIENRQTVGFDAALPGNGLLIYHIDDNAGDSQGNNISRLRYHVALEQADGEFQLEYSKGNNGDAGDPFPGISFKRAFNDLTIPDSRAYGDITTRTAVWNISDSDSLMTANFDITWSQPCIALKNAEFKDTDRDGLLEAGEPIEFYFEIQNLWLEAGDVTVSLSIANDNIYFNRSQVDFNMIPGEGGLRSNTTIPMEFSLADSLVPEYDTFYVTIESIDPEWDTTFAMEQIIGHPQVILVDADRGAIYEQVYLDDLYRHRIPARLWDKETEGTPPISVLNHFGTVIWFTGDTSENLLSGNDIISIKSYLDNGGNLFLSGQQIANELAVEDSAFMTDYLHAIHYGSDFHFIHDGYLGSPIGDGITVRYYSSARQRYYGSSSIYPVNSGVPAFSFRDGGYSAVSFSGHYNVVFFNWGYEALENTMPDYNTRDDVFDRIFEFFGGVKTDVYDGSGFRYIPENISLGDNYPNPFNSVTTINYDIINSTGSSAVNTRLKIINILGREVKTLVDARQSPGEYSVDWDGSDNTGQRVASGVYFYMLDCGAETVVKKMILLK